MGTSYPLDADAPTAERRMIVSKCETCGKQKYAYLCDGCIHDPNKEDLYEPMTNADIIRAMSDEELASWLTKKQIADISETLKIAHFEWKPHPDLQETEERAWLEWLQQPVKGE